MFACRDRRRRSKTVNAAVFKRARAASVVTDSVPVRKPMIDEVKNIDFRLCKKLASLRRATNIQKV